MKYLFFILSAIVIVGFTSCKKGNNNNYSTPAKTETVNYGSDPLQNMDLYLPKDRDKNTKTIIMVHGGGWVMGYKPDGTVTTFSGRYGWDILNPLLDKGYACAVIKYRTACYNTVGSYFTNNSLRYQEPMMNDIDLVVQNLIDNADDYIIGKTHFQLLGESAGGHIVMTYVIRQNANPAVKSAVSMFGPSDLDDDTWQQYLQSLPLVSVPPPNYFLKRANNCVSVTNQQTQIYSSLKSFADHQNINSNGTDSFLYPLCPSRVENIKKNTPIFVMHGKDDILVPVNQADKMYDGLTTQYGTTNYQLKKYDNCGHGWTGGNCNKQEVMDDIVAWMNAH